MKAGDKVQRRDVSTHADVLVIDREAIPLIEDVVKGSS